MLVNCLFYFFQAAKGGAAGNNVALGFTVVLVMRGLELAFDKALSKILEALVIVGVATAGRPIPQTFPAL